MSRFFLNRLLDVLRSMEDRRQVELTNDFMGHQLVSPVSGQVQWCYFFYQRPINIGIELDASLQGFGARWGSQIYALLFPWGT